MPLPLHLTTFGLLIFRDLPPPRAVSRPNGNGNGDPGGNGRSHGHGSSSHENGGPNGNGNPPGERNPQGGEEVQVEMGDLVGVGTPQIEEENLPEKMGIQVEGMGVQTLMIVGMEMILHPHQTPHCPKEEGIGGPDMFMYCKDLQGHQDR